MDNAAAGIVFGLLSALTWGAGDFSGGVATRRSRAVLVLLVTEISGLIALLLVAVALKDPWPDAQALAWGAAAGVAGAIGLGALYSGLARGAAALVAPVSAVVAAALPALVTITTDGLPNELRLLGFGLALLGVWLVSRQPDAAQGRAGLGLGLIAGAGFGLFFVVLDLAQAGESAVWPIVAARIVATVLVATVLVAQRAPVGIGRTALGIALVAGLLDAGGNLFFALSARAGRLDVAAVLSSLYPGVTVLLARVLQRAQIAPVQWVGLVAALAAIGLIAGS